jgi:hypothetical protein
VVVNNHEKFYLMIQGRFEHVNIRFHLYRFYIDDLSIDKMTVILFRGLLTMLIVQVIDIKVHRLE